MAPVPVDPAPLPPRTRHRGELPPPTDEVAEVAQQVEKKRGPTGPLIRDGMAGRRKLEDEDDGPLVYFSLLNGVSSIGAEAAGRKRKTKRLKKWLCPVMEEEDDVMIPVDRRNLSPVEFSSLSAVERQWYLQQVEADVLQRFRVNYPILFANQGAMMAQVRRELVQLSAGEAGEEGALVPFNEAERIDPLLSPVMSGIFHSLKLHARQAKAVEKTSPKLSAVNNMVLMIAAAVHAQLSAMGSSSRNGEGEKQWYARYTQCIEELSQCSSSSLTVLTIESYRSVGELMLRSPVIACLLPSFVSQLKQPIAVLLSDDAAMKRLDDAFASLGKEEGEENHLEHGPVLPLLPLEPAQALSGPVHSRQVSLCRKCHTEVVRLRCSIGKCLSYVCWRCEGIEQDPFAGDQLVYPERSGAHNHQREMAVYMFCAKHLAHVESLQREWEAYQKSLEGGNDDNSRGDCNSLFQFSVQVQVREAREIINVFSQRHALFSIVPQPPDGWCIFHCISCALKIPLRDLIAGVKGFVESYAAENGDFFHDKEEFLELWRGLHYADGSDDAIQRLWSCEDGDVLLPMIGQFLNTLSDFPPVKIRVWRVVNGRLAWLPPCYPEEEEEEGNAKVLVLNLLKSNPIMPHYDLLEPVEPQLNLHGFQVLRNAVAVGLGTRRFFTGLSRDGGLFHAIFNNALVDTEENDQKRWQLDYAVIEPDSVTAQRFMDSLSTVLQRHFPRFKVTGATVLHSKAGCEAQLPHTDYASFDDQEALAFGCLVGLERMGTCLDVWPGAFGHYGGGADQEKFARHAVSLNAGDLVVFRGDLVHRGAAYLERSNTRVHCYLEPADGSFQRPKQPDGTEVTHLVDHISSMIDC